MSTPMTDAKQRDFDARRQAIADEMAAIRADAEHWNRTHPDEEPIVIELDLGPEVAAALAKEERTAERWCVHIPGPDDIYPMRSKEEAETLAREHNNVVVPPLTEKWKANPMYPPPESITAVVVEWPYAPVSDEEWERFCAEVPRD